jgi:hypothetical protein
MHSCIEENASAVELICNTESNTITCHFTCLIKQSYQPLFSIKQIPDFISDAI